MNREFSYFFDWNHFQDFALQERMIAEFAENGAKYIVLTNFLLERQLNEPNFKYAIQESMNRFGLKFSGCHGLWGGDKDLCCEDKQYRNISIENHKRAMGYAADFGCKTYVVHIGARCCYYRPYDEQKIRDLACDTLEKMIPAAEKEGIVIAVENSFEPTNTADEVLYYINKFPSPNVGVCYDSGHANIMTGEGKDPAKYGIDMTRPWDNQIVFENQTLEKLSQHIVACHLHDNNGYSDQHRLPGTGTTNWERILPALAKCPRMMEMQVELSITPELSIRKICSTMDHYKKFIQ